MNKNTAIQVSTQPYKGVRDFYPDAMKIRNWMFGQLKQVVSSFGFEEYDGPFLEDFNLYAAKSGEELVNQQLYSFEDRGGRKVAIRPEMTPTLARMVAGKFNELPKPVRWFAIPNLYRYERPQRGRLREHYQFNCDLLGSATPLEDLEIFQIIHAIFTKFDAQNFYKIRINHRGLVNAVLYQVLGLNAEQAYATSKIIDKKDKITPEVFAEELSKIGLGDAQKKQLDQFLNSSLAEISAQWPEIEATQTLLRLFEQLNLLGIQEAVHFDPSIQRGLDYYTGIVFEVYDVSPENPRALFGGGRYDHLLSLFGNYQLSGIGFGMGDVGFINFLETHKLLPQLHNSADVFIALFSEASIPNCLQLAQQLRQHGLKVILSNSPSRKLGDQFKQASVRKIPWVVLQGEEEAKLGHFTLKDMVLGEQEVLDLVSLLKRVGAVH